LNDPGAGWRPSPHTEWSNELELATQHSTVSIGDWTGIGSLISSVAFHLAKQLIKLDSPRNWKACESAIERAILGKKLEL
jgi:hypothetical protein